MGRIGIGIICLFMISVLIIPVISGEEIVENDNHDPVPIISSPLEYTKYLSSKEIILDGTNSADEDGDELCFLWYSDKDGYLGTDSIVKKRLSENNHLITLHVYDGIVNVSITVSMTVVPNFTETDTDRDGIPDIIDTDDDNDGLLDIEEDTNMNGIMDPGETDTKNPDTDGDGISDKLDSHPRDPWPPPPDKKERLPFYAWIPIIGIPILIIGGIVTWFLVNKGQKKS